MISIPTWGFIIIKILEFTGNKITANKKKEKAAKAKETKEKRAREKKIIKLETKRSREIKAAFKRKEKSKRVLADIEAKLATLLRPVDAKPYCPDSER